MVEITLIGIDIAKNIFQLHGANKADDKVLKKKLKRVDLMQYIATHLAPCDIVMEACGRAHY